VFGAHGDSAGDSRIRPEQPVYEGFFKLARKLMDEEFYSRLLEIDDSGEMASHLASRPGVGR
jgi:hypothetical protein